jgi:hypothetical protein
MSPGGEVELTWEVGPLDGLAEDFEDNLAQDFVWWTPTSLENPGYASYTIDNGYSEVISDTELFNWSSGNSTLIEFIDFTCEIETQRVLGITTRGMIFRGNGPKDNDFNGYGISIAFTPAVNSHYSIVKYQNGWPGYLRYWTFSDAIDTSEDAINVLKVVVQGSTFDVYINGIYVDTVSNEQYPSGIVGFTQAEDVTARYNYLTCSYDAELMPRHIEPERGETLDIWLDEAGNPTDTPPVIIGSEPFVETERARYLDLSDDASGAEDATADHPKNSSFANPRQQSLRGHQTDELDEFVEYRIYRDNVLIGTSETESFTDQLPAYGEYEYRVTAYYDPEGESIPSVAATADWAAVTYGIVGQNTVVTSTGGIITYDAQLFSELAQAFPGATYRTFVTDPDQTVYGPTFQYNFTLAPFMSVFRPSLTQVVPANAHPGDYVFTGRLYHQGVPVLEQSFNFDKMGP